MSVDGSRDWDAATYDRVSDPQLGWAREELERLERLELRGDETVLDAGCGSGRVTALLADLAPRGRVCAVDVATSPSGSGPGTMPATPRPTATAVARKEEARRSGPPRA